MPVELVVHAGERTRRYPLSNGETVIGSSATCGVRILHPTVSRQHARLAVAQDRVEIEDLSSRNGTRIGGRRIEGRVSVEPGLVVSFGGVTALVESVAEDDLEPALLLDPCESTTMTVSDVFDRTDVATASVEPYDHFMRDRLPPLLDVLAAGGDEETLIEAIGRSLTAVLPCIALEIHEGERTLWRLASADKPDLTSDCGVSVAADGLTLAFELPSSRLATLFEPLGAFAIGLVALSRRQREPVAMRQPSEASPPPMPPPTSIEPAMVQIYADAARVARGTVSVLIRGESGTGKEVLARWVHKASRRAAGPFLAVNCAALPQDLLEAELFGIERGVATGVEARAGMFERAAGGTLMLDEVGDMAMQTQAKLLRALEVGELYRVGGRQPYEVDVRIVSATNRDLETLIADGDFREDLYFRIADWEVELPALRDRSRDIPHLAGFFLSEESRRHGRRIRGISRAAMSALERYAWPGNIRQLRKEMARVALLIGPGELLDSTRLDPTIAAAGRTLTLKETLRDAERGFLEETLAACGGDRQAAATRLGVSDITLYRRIKEYGL